MIARSLSLFEILPFIFTKPLELLNSAFPFVFDATPLIVKPPSPLFDTYILPLSFVIAAFLSTKIPSAPVFKMSKLPFLLDTNAPSFMLIPVPLLSNLRLPPSFFTLPFTVIPPWVFVYIELPPMFDASPLIVKPPSPLFVASKSPFVFVILPSTMNPPASLI